MTFKPIVKVMVWIVSGIAILVVGGFMMGAVARLWLPKGRKDHADPESTGMGSVKKTD